MMYRGLSIEQLHELLVAKKVTPVELVKEAIRLAKQDNNNAFEFIMEKEALEAAEKLGEPDPKNLLWGIPFVIKDNMSTKDVPTTGSSDILKGYLPTFNATVVQKLYDAKAIAIAKTTLDELAMGGTGTTGHLGITYNPHDKKHERLVGGSSCGSAAATANGIVPFALASDTGDSTRKPASYAGLVGLKPTWSRISRFGLFPFAPSLDTVGIFSRNVKDAAIVLQAVAGRDEKDSTSSTKEVPDYLKNIDVENHNYKIAVIKEIVDVISDSNIKNTFENSVNKLKEKGYIVENVSVPLKLLETLFPTYFVISCAEATSNNANLDGIKFGPHSDGATFEEVMSNARTKGFGELIKRRFVFGSFSLMRENKEELYIRALRNRHRIVETINEIFSKYDFIYLPAAPSIAPKIGEASDKLSDEYLIADNHLVIGNFAGLPSITLPIGFENGMPYGVNVTGRAFEDEKVLQIANEIEKISEICNVVAEEDE